MGDTGTTHRQLPLADRSPSEGELFSVQLLYLLQTREFRCRHALRLSESAARARRQVLDASWELYRRAGGSVPAEATSDADWPDWQRRTGAYLTEHQLREQLRAGRVELLRTTEQIALALARFDDLFLHRALRLPREL